MLNGTLRLQAIACATASLLLIGVVSPASAESDIAVQGADGPISVKHFPAPVMGKRPAVIILHGRQSVAQSPAPYTRYAEALAAKGIDAWLVSYYDQADAEAMNSSDRELRIKYFNDHLRNWSSRVHDVAGHVLAQDDASGKIGLLGFSNGGFLAVLSAATDPRVSALVVFYGGIAGPKAEITHLPPLLALHGDADRVIPLTTGAALVDRARALGGPAELVTYPGAGHVFDFDQTRADARDASERALSFMRNLLK
jgi:carboxymethylenebutenolidase